MALQVGDTLPHFVAKKDSGEDFDSKTLVGTLPLVIFFYPKNFTPGCTKEACDFRDSYEDFKSLGAEVIGISSDSVSSHMKFKNKYRLPFIFLSDTAGKLRKLFGVKSNLLGLLPGRETYVVDKEGIVRLKFNNMNASKHLTEAMTKMKELIAI
ncbi:peroxiredoxin [Aquimarina sp. AU474]|uniref:peroxiredoxin n=1 Tax=Aquimarina sp. AU474 TaxID=2108529 RepID=UPI000D685CF2|nr:peroxiredoxin [Aquimarina sp. AU474]